MKNFFEKTEYTADDLILLISSEAEESIHLDFKDAAALDKTDRKKDEISKDVSSFANSDGGIIIYGISEVAHKANSFSFIDGDLFTKEWLEQVINSSIQRRIPDLSIFPIRIDGKIKQTVYIVKVPKSLDAPHLSRNKRFYKRFNFESVHLEEYEIRQLYGRRLRSKLLIGGWSIRRVNQENYNKLKFILEVHIVNDGDVVEKDCKVNVYMINFKKTADFSWEQHQTNNDYTIIDDDQIKMSAVSKMPIFPGETVTVNRFSFSVDRKDALQVLSKASCKILLLYSNGEEHMSDDFAGLLQSIRTDLSDNV